MRNRMKQVARATLWSALVLISGCGGSNGGTPSPVVSRSFVGNWSGTSTVAGTPENSVPMLLTVNDQGVATATIGTVPDQSVAPGTLLSDPGATSAVINLNLDPTAHPSPGSVDPTNVLRGTLSIDSRGHLVGDVDQTNIVSFLVVIDLAPARSAR